VPVARARVTRSADEALLLPVVMGTVPLVVGVGEATMVGEVAEEGGGEGESEVVEAPVGAARDGVGAIAE